MWLILKQSLTQERHSMLARRLNRLQDVLMKTHGDDQANRIQDFKDFAHATGNGLSEVFFRRWQPLLPFTLGGGRGFSLACYG